MPLKGNNVIANVHCKKHGDFGWSARVKCHFNQPGKKHSRRVKRATKNAASAPRPAAGPVRPVIRCMTFKYNTKQRFGRGFSLAELKEAGISKKKAQTIGISVDHRRTNKSVESLQTNVQRLKEYKAKLIEFPKKGKGEAPAVSQLMGVVMPMSKASPRVKSRAITGDEKKANVFRDMRIARADERMIGMRQKKADAAAEKEKLKKR